MRIFSNSHDLSKGMKCINVAYINHKMHSYTHHTFSYIFINLNIHHMYTDTIIINASKHKKVSATIEMNKFRFTFFLIEKN